MNDIKLSVDIIQMIVDYNTESDYLPDEDSSSSEDDTLSATSVSSNDDDESNYIGDLTEDDITSVMEIAMELIDEYYSAHVLSIASAKFREEVIAYTTEIVLTDIDSMVGGRLPHADMNEITCEVHEFVNKIHDNYVFFHARPQRSMSMIDDPLTESELDASRVLNIERQIRTLTEIPQPAQKTVEWYEFRYNLITASNLWKVFGSVAMQNSLIYEKCKPLDLSQSTSGMTHTGSALHWGVKYEPITVMIYEAKFNTKVGDFGCIRHPKYSCIGASPDGINIDPTNVRYGRMLEIKNIVNRDISGIPKQEYWIQTQIQMETCDLDECDFVETRFKEYESECAFCEDNTHKYKGVILNFISQETSDGFVPIYKYMPLNRSTDQSTVNEWISTTKEEAKSDNLALFSVIYWYLDEFSCVLIPRNREWFTAACPKIESIWETILHERETGYEHRASKKRVPKPAPALMVVRLGADEAPITQA